MMPNARDMPKEILPFAGSIGYQIRTTHRMLQRYLQSKIEPHGVTLGMWYFFRVIWREEGLTQRELSERVGTMEPTTLTALRSMERAGFIRRERNGTDGRKINIFLTAEGRALEAKLLPLGKQVVDDATVGMKADERRAFLRVLGLIQKNIRQKSADLAGGADVP